MSQGLAGAAREGPRRLAAALFGRLTRGAPTRSTRSPPGQSPSPARSRAAKRFTTRRASPPSSAFPRSPSPDWTRRSTRGDIAPPRAKPASCLSTSPVGRRARAARNASRTRPARNGSRRMPDAAAAAPRRSRSSATFSRRLPSLPSSPGLRDDDGRLGALAFGAVHDRILCVNLVVTDPALRRRGLSRRVVSSVLCWARECAGAEGACLPVVASNAPVGRAAASDSCGHSAARIPVDYGDDLSREAFTMSPNTCSP